VIILVPLIAKGVRRIILARKADSSSGERRRPPVLIDAGAPQ